MTQSDKPFDESQPAENLELSIDPPEKKRSWMDKPESVDPLIGQNIGGYLILARLGAGGQSVVYQAQDEAGNRVVALKFLPVEKLESSKQVARFKAEAHAAKKLQHLNVVSIFDFGMHEQQPFIVMEYVQGTVLSDMLMRKKTLQPKETLRICRQLCQALKAAHTQRIVHRDIKPSNIIISDDGVVKLVDFGIARMSEATIEPLTKTGEVFGSPLYMSPEQCEGKKVDPRSDFYSLGCVVYECLTGAPPHVGKSIVETIFRHLHDQPLPLSQATMGAEFSIGTELFVRRLLAKEVESRYCNADAVLSDVEKLLAGDDFATAGGLTDGHLPIASLPSRQSTLQRVVVDAPPNNPRQEAVLAHFIAPVCLALVIVAAAICFVQFGNIADYRFTLHKSAPEFSKAVLPQSAGNTLHTYTFPQGATSLNLDESFIPTDALWTGIQRLPRLRTLSLDNVAKPLSKKGHGVLAASHLVSVRAYGVDADSLIEPLRKVNTLRKLTISYSNIDAKDIELLNPQLDYLDLSDNRSLSDDVLHQLKSLPELRTLILDSNARLKFDDGTLQAIKSIPRLNYISVRACQVNERFVDELSRLRPDIAIER